MSSKPARARSFDDLGPELIDVEFVVFDLETTGTNPSRDAITEIGAVRVVGGKVVEEFQTFVNPEREIPAYVARLTGITNHMVHDAPNVDSVIPTFLEFARSSVLVAHNARFDISFLKASAARLGYTWPAFDVVDTLPLARRAFSRDEVANHKLSTLAAVVRATTVPNHRALSDARATVDVLHATITRLSSEGVSHLSDLTAPREHATPAQIRQRHLAEKIPASPGVYMFVDDSGHVLYVGKSLNLRSRVRTYFTGQEKRRAVLDVIPTLARIDVLLCASETEAAIRELRLISEHRPRANKQGVRPSLGQWLRLGSGSEGLRLARKVTTETDGSTFIGPLRSRHDAEPIRSLLYSMLLPDASHDCALPTFEGHHELMRRVLTHDPTPLYRRVAERMRVYSTQGDFEKAEILRTQTELFIHAASRSANLRSFASVPLIVAARRVGVSRSSPETTSFLPACPSTAQSWEWEVFAIRYGRLLDVQIQHQWENPLTLVPQFHASALRSTLPPSPLAFGHHQESELLLQWLASPGVRVVHVEGTWGASAGAAFTLEALGAYFSLTRDEDYER